MIVNINRCALLFGPMGDYDGVICSRHAVSILLFMMDHEGCTITEIQAAVTKNFDTVRNTCLKLMDKGLMDDYLSRDRKLINRYYLTPKGVSAAMLLRCTLDLIDSDDGSRFDSFLKGYFGGDYDRLATIPDHPKDQGASLL